MSRMVFSALQFFSSKHNALAPFRSELIGAVTGVIAGAAIGGGLPAYPPSI